MQTTFGRASVPASPNISANRAPISGLAGTLVLPSNHFGARNFAGIAGDARLFTTTTNRERK